MDGNSSNKICGLNRNIFFTGLVSFFMDFSSEMVYPLVPLFLSSVLGVHKSVIGLIEGIAESTANLFESVLRLALSSVRPSQIAYGYWLWDFHLKRPLVATVPNWGQVLAYRFMDRFEKGI